MVTAGSGACDLLVVLGLAFSGAVAAGGGRAAVGSAEGSSIVYTVMCHTPGQRGRREGWWVEGRKSETANRREVQDERSVKNINKSLKVEDWRLGGGIKCGMRRLLRLDGLSSRAGLAWPLCWLLLLLELVC
jgi:hypothetical protein